MKRSAHVVFAMGFIWVGFVGGVHAAEEGKARVAVLPAVFSQQFQPQFRFTEELNITGQTELRLRFTSQFETRMEAPSFTLSLVEAFVNARKFDVLERARLTEVMQEIDFGESDYGDPQRVVPIGLALNAEYVVLPEIELIHLVGEVQDVPYLDQVRPRFTGKMIARVRITDTAQTRIVAASTEEVQVERRVRSDNTFLESEINNLVLDLYRTLSQRLVHRALEAIYPVRLLDVDEGMAVLNRGEGSIQVGDEFEIYRLGRAFVDPDTGASLGQREVQVARLRVARVAPRFAEATILEGADALTGDLSGFLCRESASSIERKTRVEQRRLAW